MGAIMAFEIDGGNHDGTVIAENNGIAIIAWDDDVVTIEALNGFGSN